MNALESPWHAGELRAQALAGVERTPNGGGIRAFMPEQHRVFFEQLPFLVAATVDDSGAPMATLLTGEPGFVTSPDPTLLVMLASEGDPARAQMVEGAPIGLLGIQLETRRRNRANGRVAHATPHGLTIAVQQSFGNCPQYIHPRHLVLDDRPAGDVDAFEGLDDDAQTQVRAADTLFVATSSGAGVAQGGVDVSHRGGPEGFVQVEGDVLTIPDYRGNRYFNTLGNLVLDPRAALLFVDFTTDRLLQLQGKVELLWNARDLAGAERAWRFTVERGWRRRSGLRQVAVQAPSTDSAAPVADAPTSETR